MNLKIGIVGLPNVGKSTLFNALVKNGQAAASNYPFTTIDPNLGLVSVPDPRLDELAAIVHPEQIIPATVEFVDIAGIIKGAAAGEGLGNKFLSHIREASAIILVARFFENPDVIHVHGKIDPQSDLETILLELILADLETVQRTIDRYQKATKGGEKQAAECLTYAQEIAAVLASNQPGSRLTAQTEAEKIVSRELQLLTSKPRLVIANISESQIGVTSQELFEKSGLAFIIPSAEWVIPISAQIEAELASLPEKEQAEFLASYHLSQSGVNRLITASFHLLGLQTYFTAGPKEVRAWTINQGWKAPQAAGVIHTDFTKGFIRAEVIAYADYIQHHGEQGAKVAGKLQLEGKDYVVQDGDVIHFRFSI